MKLPEIGELDRRVTAYSVSHAGRSGTSALDRRSSELFSLWGKLEVVGGVSYWESVNLESAVTHRIYVRYIPGKTRPQDLKHLVELKIGSVWYRARRVTDVNAEHRFTAIECEELGADA